MGSGEAAAWQISSPRGTSLGNGFGETGFYATLAGTNRVALLPSRQPVGFSFQRPDSDSEHTYTGSLQGSRASAVPPDTTARGCSLRYRSADVKDFPHHPRKARVVQEARN
jgi:hypothetical protein